MIPLVSTTVGSICAGIRSGVERALVPARAVGLQDRRDRGVARVDHVVRALGERPRDPRVDGADTQVAGPVGVERVEDALDLGGRGVRCEAEPAAGGSRQLMIVRRSCQPCAGPTGTPVARSHTTAEPRWLVIPTAATGAAVRVERGPRRVEHDRRPSRPRRTRPSPARGSRGGRSRCCSWRTVASSRTIAARIDDVPMSQTRRSISRATPRRPAGRRPGIGEPELARVEDAVRVERLLRGDEHVEGGAERVADEPRPVETDPVVVAQRAAVREDRARPRLPRGAVEGLALLTRGLAREGEVEARAVGVASDSGARWPRACRARRGSRRSRPRRSRRTATTAPRSPSCRPRSRG